LLATTLFVLIAVGVGGLGGYGAFLYLGADRKAGDAHAGLTGKARRDRTKPPPDQAGPGGEVRNQEKGAPADRGGPRPKEEPKPPPAQPPGHEKPKSPPTKPEKPARTPVTAVLEGDALPNRTQKYPAMTLAAYLAQRPDRPATVVLYAQMSNYYNYAYEKAMATHYSLSLRDPRPSRHANAWVRKDTRIGRLLFEALKDGDEHGVTLEVVLRGPDGTPTPLDRNELAVCTEEEQRGQTERQRREEVARQAEPPAPASTQAPATGRPGPEGKAERWDSVGNRAQVGGVLVECLGARVLTFQAKMWGAWKTYGPQTLVKLKLTNTSPTKVVEFAGWQETATLEDEHGNRYAACRFGGGLDGFGETTGWNALPDFNANMDTSAILAYNLSLHPGKSYITYLFFAEAAGIAREARLIMPAEALGGVGKVRLRVAIYSEERERAQREKAEREAKQRAAERDARERERAERAKAQQEERRRKEEAPRLNKKAAAYLLESAKKLIDKGQDEEAKARLDEVIRDFPATPSAEEAKRLRKDLGK
jgi:hypothetical protein